MTSQLHEQLQAALGTAYIIERELGGGGMSRVFVAEEARLRRSVVVKVLSPELAAALSAERFEREIMMAAQLAHPNIVPLLTAGDAGGVPYFTMPFVEGQSLRTRLARDGALPIPEAIGILRDVARALAFAHERGVVHRDIKPENVLLAADAAVVTDFGIARAITRARTEEMDSETGLPAPTTLTSVGMTLGTPQYMAPEQVIGDPTVDHRADIYAFGSMAFELLAGRTPFHGRTMHKALAAQINEVPPPIETVREDAPSSLASLISRCLEKDPDKRPQSARELLQALEVVTTPTADFPSRASSGRQPAMLLLIPAVALLGAVGVWGVISTRNDDRPTVEAPATAIRSVAVLPFVNLGSDTADSYFVDGVAEELATALSKIPSLRVVARSSAFHAGGKAVDRREVGRALAVDGFLDGTVRRAGDQMRVTVSLTRVGDESVLWSERYDREVKDVFAVQDEMTRAILAALEPHLAGVQQPGGPTNVTALISDRGTSDLEAYDLYMRGQYFLRRRGGGVRLAAENFEKAIARDSGFARAYAGLSTALELFPYFVGTPAHEVSARAITAARRALALDSTLATAHMSLAMAHEHAFDWGPAEASFRTALALDPNDAELRIQYGRFLSYTGRIAAGLEQFRQAKVLDPFSAVASSWVANMLRILGSTDSALVESRRALELDSTSANAAHAAAFARLAAGDHSGAVAFARRLPPTRQWFASAVYVHALAGDSATARATLRQIESERPRIWFTETAIAWMYFALGDTALGMNALERATVQRETWPTTWPLNDLIYDAVRDNPRFDALVRRVGLDPAVYRKTSQGGR